MNEAFPPPADGLANLVEPEVQRLAARMAQDAFTRSDETAPILAALCEMMVALVSHMPTLGWRLVADALAVIQLRCLTEAAAAQELAAATTGKLFAALRGALPPERFDSILAHANQAVMAWQRTRRAH
jgi:hypothetical protein